MDEETFETNLSTLKEIVLDEERLVTYVSLSKELCIHVNDSKILLRRFVENFRLKESLSTIFVNYIISGISEDNRARTTVSSEADLPELRNTFKAVFFEHIYSVSKGLSKVDNVAVLAVNRFEDFPICIGLIKSNSCVKRTSAEIGKLKTNSQVPVQVEQKLPNQLQKKVKSEHKDTNNEHLESEVSTVQATKSEPIIKTKVVSPKKEFSNNTTKSKVDIKKNGHKTQKGIAGFFSKSNSAPTKKAIDEVMVKKETVVKKEKEESQYKESKTEIMDVDDVEQNHKNNTESKVTKENGTTNKTKNKSLTQIKKNAKVDKKRKRLLHVSDSESDDDKDPFVDESEPVNNHESDDEIPPTPAASTVKITSGIINPKKRRKIVDKTYTDEDGYILTKKEEVYESCSDNEDQVNSKENIEQVNQEKSEVLLKKLEISPKDKKTGSKNSKKKITPPQKGKQATLMNFFKKA